MKAEQSAVAITGPVAPFRTEQELAAEGAAVSVSHQAAGVLHHRLLVAESGSLVISFEDNQTLWNQRLKGIQSSVAISGQAADLLYRYSMSAEAGNVTAAGQSSLLLWHQALKAEQGSLSVSGQDASFTAGIARAESCTVTINGQAVTLYWIHLSPSERTYVVPAENRIMVIPNEYRVMVVPNEYRLMAVGE